MTNKKVTKIEITSLKTILSGNNLLQLIILQHELVSSFYFNAEAIYHLFVTRQKPNKMHHCETYFQNLCYAHEIEKALFLA